MRSLSVGVTLVVTAACGASGASGADWAQWRGSNRDGRSPDVGLLKRWPDGGPKLLWRATGIGIGFSSPAIVGDTVYISGDIGDDLTLTALDMSGKRQWRVEHGRGWQGRRGPGAMGSPVVDDGCVYLFSAHGLLRCYDARGGKKKWRVDVTEKYGGRVPGWGYSESPLVYRNMCVITPGGRNTIVALDKKTGREIWRATGMRTKDIHASAIAFEHQGMGVIVQMLNCGMVGLDAKTGRELWTNRRAAGGKPACAAPVFSDGYCFGANGYGNGGACVKLTGRGRNLSAKQVWETRDMICHHGGYVVHDGYIYGNHNQGWSCLELKTGRRVWHERGVGKGSICYADGMLYTFSERRGRIGLVRAAPSGFEQTGEFQVQGRGSSWAYPVVVGGRLYLRYDDNLYCYDVRGPDFREAPAKPAEPAARPKPARRPIARKPAAGGDEANARRIYNLANTYLLNGVKHTAKQKFQEVIDKYPETSYAKRAGERLKRLE